jgi:hypothetical protein
MLISLPDSFLRPAKTRRPSTLQHAYFNDFSIHVLCFSTERHQGGVLELGNISRTTGESARISQSRHSPSKLDDKNIFPLGVDASGCRVIDVTGE